MSERQVELYGTGALRDAVRGRVALPGDDGWDAARTAWNLSVDQRPAAVVEVADAGDVVAAVRYARDQGLGVSAQPSGHGATHDLAGTILLRTGALDEIEIDTGRRRARVGAGVRWGELLARSARRGLAGLCGSSPEVSVVGYTLGGGLSWLGRRYGLAANAVTAVDLVDPDGELVTIDAVSDPDLFWAVRGGGGSFGIVAALEFELYPVAEVFGGQVAWPVEHAPAVLRAFRTLAAAASDDVSATVSLLQVPPLPELPEPIRGRHLITVGYCHAGGEAAGRELLAPLYAIAPPLLDTLATLPTRDLGLIAMDPSIRCRARCAPNTSPGSTTRRSTCSSRTRAPVRGRH